MNMRESQYQIPTTAGLHEGGAADAPIIETPEQQAVAAFFEAQNSSEYTPEMHAHVKSTELNLDGLRDVALRTPLAVPATIGSRVLGLFGVEKKPVFADMTTLIDQESLLGGQLFTEGSRFWLHPADSTGVRDWYFMFMHGEQEHTIHYQSDSTGIHKIYKGHREPFTEGEAARFVDTTSIYEQQVASGIYQAGSSFKTSK